MERIQEFGLKSWEGFSSRLSFLGFCAWSLAIPFAQIQKVRFTAISIFIIIGAFLLFLPGKSTFRRIESQVSPLILIFILIGILPLFDFWRWENQDVALNSLVLRLPMIGLPFILYQFSYYWPSNWKVIIIFCLIISSLFNMSFFLAQGVELIYLSIRENIDHKALKFFVARPYYGFLLGISFLSLFFILGNKINIWLLLIFVFFNVFEYLIVGKLFLLSSVICGVIYYFYSIRSRFYLFIFSALLSIIGLGVLVSKSVNTSAFLQLKNQGGFEFATVPKHYSNSINSRIILWKASCDLLRSNQVWLFGLGTQNFQDRLDNEVNKYNSYLGGQHLTSHNLFLGFWMQYGLFGLFLILVLFYLLFKEAIIRQNISLFLLSLFLFLSVQTEIYLDREMGVHLFIWTLVVIYLPYKSKFQNEL